MVGIVATAYGSRNVARRKLWEATYMQSRPRPTDSLSSGL
jgi:hypothetical protein